MFVILGLLCYAFAFIDFALGSFLGIDITGVFWSPVAASIVGSLLYRLDPEERESNQIEGREQI